MQKSLPFVQMPSQMTRNIKKKSMKRLLYYEYARDLIFNKKTVKTLKILLKIRHFHENYVKTLHTFYQPCRYQCLLCNSHLKTLGIF